VALVVVVITIMEVMPMAREQPIKALQVVKVITRDYLAVVAAVQVQ
jgi:hypothetical protein